MATGLFSGQDSSREKQRLADNKSNNNNNNSNSNNKVYTRKNQNKSKNPNNVPKQQQKTLAAATTTEENTTSSQPQPLSVPSDDSSSHNQLHPVPQNPQKPTNHNASATKTTSGYIQLGNKVKINLNCITKVEVRALKRKLVSELDQVRSLAKEVQMKEVSYRNQPPKVSESEKKNRVVGSLARVNSEVGSVGFVNSRSFKGSSVGVTDDNNGSEFVEKEKRTPKTNQYYKNSDFVVGKEKVENKKLKSNGEMMMMAFGSSSQLFKSCSNLLAKLMKHKLGWVFNAPVDAKKLGLHDYFTIIKRPMDLGTVKSRLSKDWYKSAREFAEDVRLTFSNAMLYNPKGQDVHYMAEQLSEIFEEKWKAIEDEFSLNRRVEVGNDVNLPTPTSRRGPAHPVLVPTPAPPAPRRPALETTPAPPAPPRPALEMRTLERAESMTMSVDSKLKSGSYGHMGRTLVPKKPKAKDPDKRDMTYEEKQRLSLNLQSLPSEKLDSIVQIIKKRNPVLFQQEDEIEVDIESVDPETLWELDRFVTNYKKSLSKYKRKAEIALQSTEEAGHNNQENLAPAVVEAPRETDAVERINVSPSPVRGEQQGDNVSRSNSSSNDSGSSSSDSDSDGSSGSDADH